MEEALGPDLRLVGTYPIDTEGLECDDLSAPSCGVPRNTTIELRFDRYLLPATAVRQAVRIFSGTPDEAIFLEPIYDVVERVLVYQPLARLEPGTVYTVQVLQPLEGGADGLRAFDGAPLGEGPVPLTFSFRTQTLSPPSSAPDPPIPTDPPPPDTPSCEEIITGPLGACGFTGCHGTPFGEFQPRFGLELDSPRGITGTALGWVARQTETGARVGQPLENPDRFGTQMPRIDPGRPGNSYVMYKMLRNPGNFGPDGCATRYRVETGPDGCPEPSEAESARLRDWFVRLEPMPPSGIILGGSEAPDGGPSAPLDDLLEIQRWIRALDAPASRAQCR